MEEFDLKELLYSFWKKRFLIVVAILVGAILGVIYTKFILKPMYQSYTTLVLAKASTSTTDNTSAINQNDLVLNQKLVSTYGEIIKSRTVLNEVIERLKIDTTYESLSKNISITSKKDTELLQITVSYQDPKVAADIANTMAEVFTNKIKEIYKIENVSIIDEAIEKPLPYNISTVKNVISFSLCALFLVMVLIFITLYFDNTITSQEEVERLLNINVIAVIPKYEQD